MAPAATCGWWLFELLGEHISCSEDKSGDVEGGAGTIAHLANGIVYLFSRRGGGARYDCTTTLPHRVPDVSNNSRY